MLKSFYLLLVGSVGFASLQQVKVGEKFETRTSTPILQAKNLYFVLSAKNLPSKDTNDGVADAFARVFFGVVPPDTRTQGDSLDRLGKTETIDDNAEPRWAKVFNVQYIKGSHQKLWVEVRDHDPANPDDIVGSAFVDLDEYVSRGQQLTVSLSGTKSGSLIVESTSPFLFTLAVKNVPPLDEFGGLSDPYVKCYFRYGNGGNDVKFHETPTVNNANNASWEQPIPFDNYQRGTNQFFHFKVKDHDSITGDDDIGEAFLEIDPFVDKKMQSVLPLSSTNNATLLINYVPFK